jgi:hypothetical protein
MLPDIAHIEIFDFYMDEDDVDIDKDHIEAWHNLVHVCREWRNLVFGSPRRLNLRILCGYRTNVRKKLDIWPLLPIVVWTDGRRLWSIENIVTALGYNDRICQFRFSNIQRWEWNEIVAAVQQPFPALKHLRLHFVGRFDATVPVFFLGGSAPSLQTLLLDSIPLPGLPNLLLSATHLIHLTLWRMPCPKISGYISPEAMLTCLSTLTRLEKLEMGFKYPTDTSRSVRKSPRPAPLTRTLLPVLTTFRFKGFAEYLEELVDQIDAPLLDNLHILFFHQLKFDTPQLAQFISRTPKLKAQDRAGVVIDRWDVWVTVPQTFSLGISSSELAQQLLSLTQVCRSSFPQAFILAVEHLYIIKRYTLNLLELAEFKGSRWLDFFHPFTAVKGLYLSEGFAPCVALSLQKLATGSAIEVLPALQTLFLEETHDERDSWIAVVQEQKEAIGQLVVARRFASHPVAVSPWIPGNLGEYDDIWEKLE